MNYWGDLRLIRILGQTGVAERCAGTDFGSAGHAIGLINTDMTTVEADLGVGWVVRYGAV